MRVVCILIFLVAFGGFRTVSEAVEFRTDVMAVLSKAGCNVGGCHGNGSGKGGLRLSLRGQDPDLDWAILTREEGGRRTNVVEPAQSLILQKATAQVAHEGGKRFDVDSPEYRILLEWLQAGAPDSGQKKQLAHLEVAPGNTVLIEPEQSVPLKATAVFRDGERRDVTRLAVYEPNNQAATVSLDGVVSRAAFGETTVLVRYLHQQVPVTIAFVPARPDFTWADPPPANFIDELVFAKLRRLRMNPSGLCDDTTFLRRAYLDLLGVLPTADTARAFLADTAPDKRTRLIERLLERPEFADHWALKWADLLRIEERQLDQKGMRVFHSWIREAIAANKPLDTFAREIIAARGSTYENPPANWWRANRDPVSRAENTSRVFLGTQLNCAQCHNHPFERWTQEDYYSWTALFARIDYKIVENKRTDQNDQKEFKGDQIVLLKDSASVTHPRTGDPAPMRFLGGDEPKTDKERDELMALADWLSRSPLFARMQVNRVWYHLFGRGLVEPIDDFRASNPPAHPELLDRLAQEFAAHSYDLRWLIRTITASRTYQLAAEPNATNASDESLFSRATPRRLTAEQLLDSMSKAIGTPLNIDGFPAGTRLAQVPEGRKHYKPLKTSLDRFAATFGKPPRLVASECERSNEPAMPQAFQMMSGQVVHQFLTHKGNLLSALIEADKPAPEIVETLCWSILSRAPAEEELRRLAAHIESAAPEAKRAAVEDVAWAFFNSKEFVFRR